MTKRIVVIHTRGPYKGLWQVLGTCDQLQANMHTTELPTFVPDVDFLSRRSGVSLVKVREHYALYRETMTEAEAPEQHPQQR